jgi:hypothetical protein
MRASRRTIDLEPFAVAKATLARLTTYPLQRATCHQSVTQHSTRASSCHVSECQVAHANIGLPLLDRWAGKVASQNTRM